MYLASAVYCINITVYLIMNDICNLSSSLHVIHLFTIHFGSMTSWNNHGITVKYITLQEQNTSTFTVTKNIRIHKHTNDSQEQNGLPAIRLSTLEHIIRNASRGLTSNMTCYEHNQTSGSL